MNRQHFVLSYLKVALNIVNVALFLLGLLESLHAAAYKNALSNSINCPEYMVGKISTDQVRIKIINVVVVVVVDIL